jgi:hypothetical protein
MSQFVQGGSTVQSRMEASLPTLVGLVNGNGYVVGLDGSLTNLAPATSPGGLTTAQWQPFLRYPYIIDLGADQPRGFIYSLYSVATLTGLAGGNIFVTGVNTPALTSSSINPLLSQNISGVLAGSTKTMTWFPANVATATTTAINADIFVSRYVVFSIFATTWPASGGVGVYLEVYS